ncbi:hypothetical protein NDU88_007989 [Pleurodeles waltl]|uniref:Uncharacterized protein n=1 Tax=Pleurodeles waltl TaxID=8319 RepID=A0AAV7N3N2_PLEWA|nr:hypothetical protein NDU88_007989 [Pleurodeles waltl]
MPGRSWAAEWERLPAFLELEERGDGRKILEAVQHTGPDLEGAARRGPVGDQDSCEGSVALVWTCSGAKVAPCMGDSGLIEVVRPTGEVMFEAGPEKEAYKRRSSGIWRT